MKKKKSNNTFIENRFYCYFHFQPENNESQNIGP